MWILERKFKILEAKCWRRPLFIAVLNVFFGLLKCYALVDGNQQISASAVKRIGKVSL